MNLDQRLAIIEDKLDYLIALLMSEEDEQEQQYTLDGESCPPDRDQSQTL